MRVQLIDGVRATWYVAWLLSAVAAAWAWGRRPELVAAAAASAAVLCLVVPLSLLSVPQAMFLGALSGIAVRTVVLGARIGAMRLGGAQATAALAVGLLWSAGVTPLAAAEPNAAAPASVLYPIDAAGQPQGDDLYAPEALLAKLLAAGREAPFAGAAAVLTDARYAVALQRAPSGDEVVCESCTLVLRWQSFQERASVKIPIREADAQWFAARHTLNGAPATIQWDPDGQGASIELVDVGLNELRLQLIPRVERLQERVRLQLHVPPLAGSTVEVVHPAGLRDVVVSSSVKSARQSSATRTVALTSAQNILEASWPAIVERASQPVAVDQLAHLQIEPAAAHLDVHLRLSGDAAPLRSLELAIAPQLELAPLPEDTRIEQVETLPGSPTIVRLTFRTPLRLPSSLALRFQLQRAMSVGRIGFPKVEVLGAETRRSHFAMSTDPRLRTSNETSVGLVAVAPAEVEELWDVSVGAATAFYAVEADQPEWSIEVEPVAPQFAARETLELLCRTDRAEVSYTARVSELTGDVLLHQVAVSPRLEIEQVAVSLDRDQSPIPVRWARADNDQVWVLLGRPLAESHTVLIVGRAPYAEAKLQVPRVALQGARQTSSEVVVRRTSDVLAEWAEGAQPRDPSPASSAERGGEGRLLVGRYAVLPAETSSPELRISRNQVQWTADAVVMLDPSLPEPLAICVIRVEVTRGTLDRVRLAASKNWQGPFTAEPAAEVATRSMPDDPQQRLIDVPLAEPAAAGAAITLRVSGPLALDADRRIRMPQVRVLGAGSQRTFVMLPEAGGSQTTQWTLTGLRREELPRALRQALGSSLENLPQRTSYRALREGFVAEQRVFPDVMRTAAVRLVETRGSLDAAGYFSAVTELVVQPGPATEGGVRLPAGAELLYAAVNDVPVDRPRLADGVWQAPPGPAFLPRILTVGYRQRLSARGGAVRFNSPQAVVAGQPLPAQPRWQIATDASFDRVVQGKTMSQDEFAAASGDDRAAAASDASPLVLQLPEWESREWFRPWLKRLPEENAEQVASPESAAAPTMTTDDGSRRERAAGSQLAWYASAPDGTLTLERAFAWPFLVRWLIALAMIATGALGWRSRRRLAPLAAGVRRWPQAIGVLVGLFWWTMLSPGVVGLAIVGVSAAAIVRQARRSAEASVLEKSSIFLPGPRSNSRSG